MVLDLMNQGQGYSFFMKYLLAMQRGILYTHSVYDIMYIPLIIRLYSG